MDPYKKKFFSLSELKQPVNQWLCIAFIGVWAFWIMLYHFTDKAQAFGKNLQQLTPAEIIELTKS